MFSILNGWASSSIKIDNVKMNCAEGFDCDRYLPYVESISEKEISLEEIKQKMKFILNESSIKNFSYKIDQEEKKIVLNIYINPKKIVDEIIVNVDDDINLTNVYKILPLRNGSTYDEKKDQEIIEVVGKYFEEISLPAKNIEIKKVEEETSVSLYINVITGGAQRIRNINIDGINTNERLSTRFKKYKGRIWDRVEFKVDMDQYEKDLHEEGYYHSKITINEVSDKEQKWIDLNLNINLGPRFGFLFNGVVKFSRQEIMSKLRPTIAGESEEINIQEVLTLLNSMYEEVGIYNSEIKWRKTESKDKDGHKFISYYFDINEGKKTQVAAIDFLGNSFFSNDDLLELYYKNATDLSTAGFLDKKYNESFLDILKNEYLKKGYIFAKIEGPDISEEKNNKVTVHYKVKERQQCIITLFNINGVNQELANKLKANLSNYEGQPINVIEFENDLTEILKRIREEGYFFAAYKTTNANDILHYHSNYSEVSINLDITTEKKTILEDVLVTGNFKTRSKVILREVDIQPGEEITPSKLEEIKDKLTSLSLFSYVKISPVILNRDSNDQNYRSNLLIQLKEKDFGIFEIAPGFRTDIGLKVSTGLTYNNIFGLNLLNSARAQMNQRLDYSTLDPRRRGEKKKRPEMYVEDIIGLPYVLDIPVRFEGSVSWARRRFYGFDADIFRSGAQLSKTLQLKNNKKLDLLLRYQIEAISQFDATDTKDDRYYRIGSLTPTVNYDTRDDVVNPHRGAFFSVSYEFARPAFGSMSRKDLEINYDKLISRNRFYLPLGDLWTLAVSISFGQQKNNARQSRVDDSGNTVTVGQIPSIKVFRLEGVDIVRGFSDSEINRLITNRDISEEVIDKRAYFSNFKLEPRYMINDKLVAGPFFDAGHVYKNHWEPTEVRTSVGMSMKYLTPVGSLDFDYGAKTKRERYGENSREKFGRFHLSIGFF